MSEPTPEDAGQDATGIGDDQLPDDLQPGEDNPLAEGLEPGETAGDLLEEGKHADQDQQDQQDEQDGSSTSQDD
ncbi:hypothetical protein GGQ22_19360 [Nocardioides sp. zg-579]|uniref:Uncharacterized protein n=1 Tax=Nocardioides marmotae TaxID=2663857 RepID=A0A6I3JGG5_9ACTN|nr:hypothetical protein [Nocardioides marmotae]MCR6033573.1 hypothetical protein [Gordonia jinghuaiqii]MTB97231.1 hypothetical protein [Nocardioides marmotae]QKE02146.1 hypothetical protein HPC71_14480 [Nocardioides marmotae]